MCSAKCLEYIGQHFRGEMGRSKGASPHDVAYEFLEEHVFPHIPPQQVGDKLALLLQMLNKLYALVRGGTHTHTHTHTHTQDHRMPACVQSW